MASDNAAGHARVKAKERNNYPSGRSGGGADVYKGPASKHGVAPGNPTKGGGVTRPNKGL